MHNPHLLKQAPLSAVVYAGVTNSRLGGIAERFLSRSHPGSPLGSQAFRLLPFFTRPLYHGGSV